MIGRNTLLLNAATVQRAIEEYLDRQRRNGMPKLKVHSVQSGASNGFAQEFVVEVVTEEAKPQVGGSVP